MGRHEDRRPVVDVEDLVLPNRVELRGSDLAWVFRPDAKVRARVPSSPIKLLQPFLGLAEASPERILEFARSSGVLALCRHGLPTSHAPIAAQASVFSTPTAYPEVTQCLPLGAMDEGFQNEMLGARVEVTDGLAGWEPIAYWRATAKMMAAALKVHQSHEAGRRAMGRTPRPWSYWQPIYDWPPAVLPNDAREQTRMLTGEALTMPRSTPKSLEDQLRRRPYAWPYAISPQPDWDLSSREDLHRDRYQGRGLNEEEEKAEAISLTQPGSLASDRRSLDNYITGLLEIGHVRLSYRGANGTVRLATGGLFGALALQLMRTMFGSSGFAICEECANFYAPLRRPRAGLCPTCSNRVGSRKRQQRLRERLRSTRVRG